MIRRLRDNERGAAMVEAALILPIVLMILLGIFDFGRALNYWNDTNQLAADGARFAAVNRVPGDAASLEAYLKSQADTPELEEGGTNSVEDPIQVCVDYPNGAAVGEPVTVKVESAFNLLPAPLQGVVEWGTVPIRGEATMRIEVLPSDIPQSC